MQPVQKKLGQRRTSKTTCNLESDTPAMSWAGTGQRIRTAAETTDACENRGRDRDGNAMRGLYVL